MAYLDEVTGIVYDGNHKIQKGKKTRITTTYEVFVNINGTQYRTLCNSKDKQECMKFILDALSYSAYKLKSFNNDIDKFKITIKESKDNPYAEINFVLL